MNAIFLLLGLALLCTLVYFLTSYILKNKKIRRVSKVAWKNHKDEIINAIEEIGEEQSSAILFFFEDRKPAEKCTISLPKNLPFPWAGRSIEISTRDEVSAKVLTEAVENSKKTSKLSVPRIRLKNGRSQYIWSPSRYLSKSKGLRSLFSELKEQDQTTALNQIMENSIRVNGGLEWVQNAEFPNCGICKKRMSFILQLSGLHFQKNRNFDIHESEIYIFGCTRHTDELRPVLQFF